jgi:hypothetical protein
MDDASPQHHRRTKVPKRSPSAESGEGGGHQLTGHGPTGTNPARGIPRLPLASIFPCEDYGHRFKIARGDPAAFFGRWDASGALLDERRQWLRQFPNECSLTLPEAEPLMIEARAFAASWGIDPDPGPASDRMELGDWAALGSRLEPDLILLTRHPDGPRMVAACVCFPSSWAPEAKLGLSLDLIHTSVPGLNAELGPTIGRFLDRLRPGAAWLRANWGMSASPERNQHPNRRIPRLAPPIDPRRVWVRIEHQALIALPRCGGILFGIRVERLNLDQLRGEPLLAAGLARALRTMPEEMARYKGVDRARDDLVQCLINPRPA